MLVVFYENLLEIILSFVIGELKFPFFVGQNLNFRIIFILERREYFVALPGFSISILVYIIVFYRSL